MVLEWTLGLKRLAYSRIDLSLSVLQRQSTSQGNMGDSEPPYILCESCACIIHTNLQSCMSIFSETLHDEESLRDSKLPVSGCLRTKGQDSLASLDPSAKRHQTRDRSQCMKLVLVSFTLFYSTSYMCN